MTKKKIIFVLLVLLTLPIYRINSLFAKNVTPTVKIGVLLPLTGPLREEAKNNLDGHRFAVDEINREGGIKSLGGSKLELLVGDTRGDPDIASRETERLIKEGVAVLAGSYQSTTTYTSTEVAERSRIPFLITTSLADMLTKRGFKFTFRIEPSLSQFVEAQYRFLEDNELLGKTQKGRIALLYERTLWGQTSAQLQRAYADKNKYNIVADIAYPNNLQNLKEPTSDFLKQLAGQNPDIILYTSYLNDSVQLAHALKDMGIRPKAIIGTGAGAKNPEFVEKLGADAEYWMVINEWNEDMRRSGNVDLNSRFRKQFGYDMNGIAAVCYAATWVAKEAFEKSASTVGTQLRASFAQLNLTHGPATILPMARILFDDEGNNMAMPIVTQIQSAKHRTVWPREIAAAKPIFGNYYSGDHNSR